MSDFLKIGFFPVHNRPLYNRALKLDNDYAFGALIETNEFPEENLYKFDIYYNPWINKQFPSTANFIRELKTSLHVTYNLFLNGEFKPYIFLKTNHLISQAIDEIGKEQKGAISFDKIENFLFSILETYHLESIYDTDEQFQNRWGRNKLKKRQYLNWYQVKE